MDNIYIIECKVVSMQSLVRMRIPVNVTDDSGRVTGIPEGVTDGSDNL